ncbi:MAG: tetratricopeptide repeat protein [Opitutaceae bacterium]
MSRWLLAALAAAAGARAEPPADLAAAAALYRADRVAEAGVRLDGILAAAPGDPEANYYRGMVAADLGDWKRAVACERRAIASGPNIARYQEALGDAYGVAARDAGIFLGLDYARRCLSAYQKAVALEPRNVDYRANLLVYYQRAPKIAGGGLDRADAEAENIARLDPVRGDRAFAALYGDRKNYDAAVAALNRKMRAAPDDRLALYEFGRLAAITGRNLDRGLLALRRCLELAPRNGGQLPHSWEVHWRLGTICEKRGDRAAARAHYTEALKERPDLSPVKQALQRLAEKSG